MMPRVESCSSTSRLSSRCYTSEQVLEQRTSALRDFLHRMGRDARQGAVGLVIDRDYLEIGFPLESPPSPARPTRKKRK